MTLICESKYELSRIISNYNIVKWKDLDMRLDTIVDLNSIWTTDSFDDYCTDAYIQLSVYNSPNTDLEDLLLSLVPYCSQIILFYWFDDIYTTITKIENVFNNGRDFIQYIKEAICKDYKCMFSCWYKCSR